MDNLQAVLHQMEAFGIELKPKDEDLIRSLDGSRHEGKRKTCGAKGKDWFKFYIFRPDHGRATYITGSFGTYRHGGSWEKVEQNWAPLSEAERDRQRREREAAAERAARIKEEERQVAAMEAAELWRYASPAGQSPYLQKKGLEGESCRYLPDGTLVLPLLRYDLPRNRALQACQRILPNGRKLFTKGFSKPACALRLGAVDPRTPLVLVVEGYATGLSVRIALDREFPVYVALDAGNLLHVVPMLADLHSAARLLICADDDWKTVDQQTGKPNNPGRTAAKTVARLVPGCDIVWPVFDRRRAENDTDFDDLRQRQGLDTVRAQLQGVVRAMGRMYG